VCPCTACERHTALQEAEVRRQAAVLERARRREQAAGVGVDATTRTDTITEAIGPTLHGRIVAAAIAASPVHQRRQCSPARLRGIAAAVYADHGHDLEAIRAYALTLPPGPAETAPDAGDEPGDRPGWAVRCVYGALRGRSEWRCTPRSGATTQASARPSL